ncbi:MAG: YhgE/Pip domain-containing protein [Coriobacteriales bacterium]|nr:YhgE/Pip domain-containing protein [Coriobacteriales bacterium]
MKRIFAVLNRDYQHVRGNVIAMLVCIGLAVMPSLYAWFNIAGGWDPYGNTGQLKVAIASSDEGLEGTIIPFRINVGERVVNTLAESTKIGYVATSEEEAIDGVASGKYYAAVVIPEDFSTKLLSVLSSSPSHPQLDYYVNEKRNAIASIVTGKASGSVQTMINEGFNEAIADAATEVMDEVSSVLDDEQIVEIAASFGVALDGTLGTLRRSADNIMAYKEVVASIRGVMEASNVVMGDNSVALDAASMLNDAATGIRKFDSAASSVKDNISSAISRGKGALEDVETAIDEAINVADGKADELDGALTRVREVVVTRIGDLQSLRDSLANLNGKLVDFSRGLEGTVGETDINIQYSHTVTNNITDLLSRLDNALVYLNDLVSTADRTVSDLRTSKDNLEANRAQLKQMAVQAREGIEAVRNGYNDNFTGSLDQLANAIDAAAADATTVSTNLRNEVNKLSPALNEAAADLKGLEDTLDKTATKINDTVDKVGNLRSKVVDASSSGNAELVRKIFAGDPSALVEFFTAPVELDREAIYPVDNNGSAMTPYYTTMALWVGGTLMGILIYASVSKKTIEEVGAEPRHAYFGRLLFFLTIGFFQSTILLLGDLFFLRVQCADPLLFMLTGWLASLVFINVIYSLSVSFGDVGKAIGVLFMVIQVAGSGGTFPVEMLPKLFQQLYSLLPFVYSENAFRAAMFGTYGNDWLMSVGTLALYLIPALLLGLVLRKPLVPVNEWIEEKLEETKLM